MDTKIAGLHLAGDPAVVKWGYLFKKGGDRRNWTHRFFILKDTHEKNYCIEYYKDHKVCEVFSSSSFFFSLFYFFISLLALPYLFF